MNDIVAGVQQYQSSLLDNLQRQMKDVNSVIRKQFSCVDAEEIPIAPTIIRKKRGGSRECLIKDKLSLASLVFCFSSFFSSLTLLVTLDECKLF
ncbi:unnamed protein product [Arctogadus glacialis]